MTDEWAANHDFELPPIQYARAVLTRWGSHPRSPDRSGNLKAGLTRSPVDEEVAELVAWLRRSTGCADESPMDLRAADPLERLGPPQSVPVSERLPGDQLCWWYASDEDDDGTGYGGNWTLLRISGCVSYYTHWLPAHALPLPTISD